jgi:hypothetical protein
MPSANLIVCERSGNWAAALRQSAGACRLPLRETRSFSECREVLARAPASPLAIELAAPRIDEALDLLAELPVIFPRAAAVVLAERALSDYEWLAREFGAVAFLASPRDLRPIVRLARRHLAAAPAVEGGLTEQILAQLPWSQTT